MFDCFIKPVAESAFGACPIFDYSVSIISRSKTLILGRNDQAFSLRFKARTPEPVDALFFVNIVLLMAFRVLAVHSFLSPCLFKLLIKVLADLCFYYYYYYYYYLHWVLRLHG